MIQEERCKEYSKSLPAREKKAQVIADQDKRSCEDASRAALASCGIFSGLEPFRLRVLK